MAAIPRTPSLDGFLAERRAQRGAGHTHTRIRNSEGRVAGGSYNVPACDQAELIGLYYRKVFGNKMPDHLTEKQLRDDGPLLVDLDLRYAPEVDSRQHADDHIEDLVVAYLDTIDSLLSIPNGTTLPVTVMHKPQVNQQEGKTKDGVHLVFELKTPRALNLMVRKRMLTELASIWDGLPITNSWEDVLDEGVAKGSVNWQMYGSCKPGNQAYIATHHYTARKDCDAWAIGESDMTRFDTEKMLPRMSARNSAHTAFELKAEHRQEFQALTVPARPRGGGGGAAASGMPSRYDAVRSEAELDAALAAMWEDINPADYKLKETHDFTMVLPDSFYGPGSYNNWMRVGWALHNTSPKLFFSWIKFSAQPGGRGTLQKAAGGFDWSMVPELFETWRGFGATRPDGLTHRSIMYWAKQSARAEYEKVREQTIDFFIDQTVSRPECLEYDLANVLYNIYKDQYVCVSIKNRIWYEYRSHRWHECDSGTSLRQRISTDMHKMYVQKVIESTRKMDQIEQANDDWDKSRKRTKKLCDTADLLKRTAWKRNIMTEAMELFFDKDFYSKLDQNPYLMCFSNGVVDFQKKIHRKGQPDDYISKCTNIEYKPLSQVRGTKEFKEVSDFMEQLFPKNPDLKGYMYQHLASCLLGTNQNQTFNIYKGMGSNGKSKLVELMTKVMGEYKGTVPFALLTQKRSSIGSTSSEIVQLMGVRYAVMQEPSKGDKVNEGIMKEITGGDPIQGRALFKDTVTFVPQFKLVVCTNVDIEFMSNDDGTWRRIRVCDFKSRFVQKPFEEPDKYPLAENPHQFKIDKTLEKKLDRWAPILASHLADIAFDRQGEVDDCAEVMASSDKYRERQDMMSEFAAEMLAPSPGDYVKKKMLMTNFNEWVKENYGRERRGDARDVVEFMTKRYGSYHGKKGWANVKLDLDQEDTQNFAENDATTAATTAETGGTITQ